MQRGQVDVCRLYTLFKDLEIDDREESGCVYTVRLAYMVYRLLSNAHLQPETADDLDRVLLMRHEIAYLISSFVHTYFLLNRLQSYKKNLICASPRA